MGTSSKAIVLMLLSTVAWARTDLDCDPALKAANGGTCPPPAPASVLKKGLSDDQKNPAKYSTESCSYTRLDWPGKYVPGKEIDHRSASMARVGVLDQDGLGLCYSYAGAELTDAWRFSHGDTDHEFRTSPLFSAVSNVVRSDDSIFDRGIQSGREAEGGFIAKAIESNRHTVCDSRAIVDHSDKVDVAHTLDLIEAYFKAYKKYKHDRHEGMDTLGGRYDYALKLRQCLISQNYPEEILPSAEKLSGLFSGAKAGDFFARFLIQECNMRTHYKLDLPPTQNFGDVDTADSAYADRIKTLFDKDRPQPVGISYCASVLKQGAAYHGLDRSGSEIKDGCGAHASVVIGQRYNPDKKRCELLVQNSWGTGCGYYSADWECRNGRIWVDRDALTANIFGLTYFEGK